MNNILKEILLKMIEFSIVCKKVSSEVFPVLFQNPYPGNWKNCLWKFIVQKAWEPWKSQFLTFYPQNRNSTCANMGQCKHVSANDQNFRQPLLRSTTGSVLMHCLAFSVVFLHPYALQSASNAVPHYPLCIYQYCI